jgi:hypothetical protein
MDKRGDNPLDDDAVAKRLSRLRSRPVDVSGVARRLEGQIGQRPSGQPFLARFTRARIAAAILLIATLAGALTWTLMRPVTASAADLAQIHHQTVEGGGDAIAVSSMLQAQHEMASRWPRCPMLPDTAPKQVKSCCARTLGRKRLCCVGLDVDGQAVTLAVARAGDVRFVGGSSALSSNGTRYLVQSAGATGIVILTPGDPWIAVIGTMPMDGLMSVADGLRRQPPR